MSKPSASDALIDLATFFEPSIATLKPVKQIILYLKEAIFSLNDKQQIFHKIILELYFRTFLEGLVYSKKTIEIKGHTLTPDDFITFNNREKIEFQKRNFRVEDFKIDNFYKNDIIKYLDNCYFQKIVKDLAKIEDKNFIDSLKLFMLDHLEINFHLWLDTDIGKNQFKKYIYSNTYPATLKFQLRTKYEEELKKLYFEKVLNEDDVSLQKIYVEPYFQVLYNSFKKNDKRVFPDQYSRKETVIFQKSLHIFINDYIKEINSEKLKTPLPQFILVLGYPGQGKSSFCKRFLFDIFSQQNILRRRIYFVQLRHISNKEIFSNPIEVIRKEVIRQSKAFFNIQLTVSKDDFEEGIIVLDGLDEFYMSEDFEEKKVISLCKNIIRNELRLYKNMRIIMTSRYGRVTIEDFCQEDALVILLQPFNLDQQKKYLTSYVNYTKTQTKLTVFDLEKFNNDEKKYKHIKELIELPILLQLIAQLPEKIDKDLSRAEIYQKVFTLLIEKAYDKYGKLELHKDLKFNPSKLRNIVRELAYAIFKEVHGYIHKDKLLEVGSTELKVFFKDDDVGDKLRMIMMAFYLKEIPKNNNDRYKSKKIESDYAIEFLHKSLQEYMAAEYIFNIIKYEFIYTKFSFPDQEEIKYSLNENNSVDALKVFWDLFSEKELSFEIVEHLIEIIDLEEKATTVELAERLAIFFPYFAEIFFVYTHSYSDKKYKNPYEIGLDVFYGYWTIFSYLNKIAKITIPSLGNLIKQFLKSRYFHKLTLSNLIPFELVNLEKCKFGTDLSGTDLKGAFLIKADLSGVNLSDANLERANITSACLESTYLNNAKLEGADLTNANLKGADLNMGNLKRAILKGAVLASANLSGTNLEGANLEGVNLKNALLINANLKGANLSEANLEGVNLTGVDLTRANLTRAIL